MKLKILTVILMLTLLVNTSISVIGDNNVKTTSIVDNSKVKEVRVAMLSEFPIHGWVEALPCFIAAIDGYQWTVGNNTYKFKLTKIYDKDVIRCKLNTKNYDMLLVPGGGVGDGEALTKGILPNSPRVKIWKNQIIRFIQEGGGYVGYCGGAMIMAESIDKPSTLGERIYDRGTIDASCVKKSYYGVKFNLPITLSKITGLETYLWTYQEPLDYDTVEECAAYHGGVPLDIQILKNNPIFDDFSENTQRIMWVGGPALVLPDDSDGEATTLAKYPAEEMSKNESTKIHIWKYVGGIRGLISGFVKGIKICKENKEPRIDVVTYMTFLAGDWEQTDKIVETNFSNKPCMTTEIYPNENKGRIFLCALHPEYSVWWGGHVEEKDTDYNCMQDGLFNWVNTTPHDKTPGDEISHNWWMIRRQVAWAAKIPDNDLPPVYGASQVGDIYPYEQPSSFNIIGNTKEESEGIVILNLYYRYSADNSSWGDWTPYGTDTDGSDGWSWEFNETDGLGYYQFYSIRNVEYEDHIETETVPPGPDAIVHVIWGSY